MTSLIISTLFPAGNPLNIHGCLHLEEVGLVGIESMHMLQIDRNLSHKISTGVRVENLLRKSSQSDCILPQMTLSQLGPTGKSIFWMDGKG